MSRNAAKLSAATLEADHTRAEYQDVGVVVLPRKGGGRDIVAQGGTNMAVPVGRDADADARAADQDAAAGAPLLQCCRQRIGEVRVVDRTGIVRAQVEHLEPALLDGALQHVLQLEAGMVGGKGDGTRGHGRLFPGRGAAAS